MTPAPRFTPHVKRGAQEVVRELGSRRQAFLSADSKRLMRVVDGYMGVPYKWGGTTRNGMDCSAMTRAIVNKLLHRPFDVLRKMADEEAGDDSLFIAQRLFGVDSDEDSDSSRPGEGE